MLYNLHFYNIIYCLIHIDISIYALSILIVLLYDIEIQTPYIRQKPPVIV